MKRFLKITGIILLVGVVAVVGAASFIAIKGIPEYEPGNVDLQVEVTPERVERGVKLVSMLCQHCHFDEKTGKFSGRLLTEVPADFGEAHSANITNHPTSGVDQWTDGELAFFLRTGIKRDGKYAPPWMPKLIHVSDEDLFSVIAFLRSDNPWVQASDAATVPCKPSFLMKMLSNTAFKPTPYPERPIPPPDTSNKTEYGKYITLYQLECYGCHSADFRTVDIVNPEKSVGFFGGGNLLNDMEGRKLASANITPDKETGIGNWTEEQFIKAVKYGQKDGSNALRFPMQPFPQLTDYEASCIWEFLKTVPPLTHQVNRDYQE